MSTRREWLGLTLGATAGALAVAVNKRAPGAGAPQLPLITRAVPSTGERLPVVGLVDSLPMG